MVLRTSILEMVIKVKIKTASAPRITPSVEGPVVVIKLLTSIWEMEKGVAHAAPSLEPPLHQAERRGLLLLLHAIVSMAQLGTTLILFAPAQ
jgi:hypothetical protein